MQRTDGRTQQKDREGITATILLLSYSTKDRKLEERMQIRALREIISFTMLKIPNVTLTFYVDTPLPSPRPPCEVDSLPGT